MGGPVLKIAVVGEEEQPFRIVKSRPTGKSLGARGQEIHHHRPGVRILRLVR
jgi:hypothetical protein